MGVDQVLLDKGVKPPLNLLPDSLMAVCDAPEKVEFILQTLSGNIDRDVIEGALWHAASLDDQMDSFIHIISYADENFPDLLNQYQKGLSLITFTIREENLHCTQMVAILLRMGMLPGYDNKGNNPLDMLNNLGYGDTSVAKDISLFQEMQRRLTVENALNKIFDLQAKSGSLPPAQAHDVIENNAKRYLMPPPEHNNG